MVLAFSGKIGSGKSSVSAAVAHVLQLPLVSFGGYVRQQAQLLALEPTRKQLQDLGESLLQADAQSFCAAVLAQAPSQAAGLVVDGIRHESVLQILRQLVLPQQLLHIHLTLEEEVRTERVTQRQRETIDEEEQRRIISHPTEVQVVDILPSLADIIIDSVDELDNTVSQVIKQVKLNTHGK
jgi:cytidylate kinase